MNKLARFSVDYPITVFMIVLAVLLLGYISFSKLGMDLFPDLNNPRIFVEIKAGERPPEEIEKQFVKNIEALSIQQKGAVKVSSVIQTGAALVTVEYAWDTNMNEAFLNLQKTLTSFTQNEEIDELVISQHDPNATPIITLGLSHPDITDMDELRLVAENYLRNELIRMEGIADVEIMGQEEKEVVISTNNYLMKAYGVTPSIIAGRIGEYNRNVSGGSIVEMGLNYIIKGVGEFNSLEDISNLIITYKTPEVLTDTASATGEKTPVFLKDIAEIEFRNKKPDNIVRIDGKRCLGLSIYKETKFNTVKIVDTFFENLDVLRSALPGYELTIIQNQGAFITNAIDEVKQAALIGIFFAMLILFVFLRRIGTTVIISLAIPISIVATFNLMYFRGLTLNIMTLGGLALGAGMLVDNSIVVMESIFRNLESGLSLKEASVAGTSQVAGAITASTVTTIVVFLPIVYLHGTAGELFREQAWTVAFSLLSSLMVALLIIPMLSTKILKGTAKTMPRGQSIRFPRYRKFLSAVLGMRWLVISGAVVLTFAAFRMIPLIGSEFMPGTDLNKFSIDIQLPEGTELFRTENVVDNIEKNIRGVLGNNVKTIYSTIGPSEGKSGDESDALKDENSATIKLILTDNTLMTPDIVFQQLDAILSVIPDLESNIIQEETALELTLGTEAAPIAVEISGEDLELLQELTEQAREQLNSIEDLYNIETSFDEGRPEIEILLDRTRAGLNNVSINQLGTELRNQLMGTNAGKWESEGEMRDITLELPKIGVHQLEDIVIAGSNRDISLYEIADIHYALAPKEILRENQTRVGEITAHLKKTRPLDHVVGEINEKMSSLSFPPDYTFEITGEEQKRRDAFDNLKFALILSVILVYMVMASQFESLIHPFTILLSIPLATVGALLIFLILGRSLNIMAYIGIIMLAGIAVNDSIILVDAINQLKSEGRSRHDAIIEAGQRRIRPIIMTSLTTILALLPLTFGFGEGAALRSPMALAVIGGLITSTLLTLVVIPCVYSVMDAFGERLSSLFS